MQKELQFIAANYFSFADCCLTSLLFELGLDEVANLAEHYPSWPQWRGSNSYPVDGSWHPRLSDLEHSTRVRDLAAHLVRELYGVPCEPSPVSESATHQNFVNKVIEYAHPR